MKKATVNFKTKTMLLLKNITKTDMVQRAVTTAAKKINKPELTNQTINNVFLVIENGETLGFMCCSVFNKKAVVKAKLDTALQGRINEVKKLASLAKKITLESLTS